MMRKLVNRVLGATVAGILLLAGGYSHSGDNTDTVAWTPVPAFWGRVRHVLESKPDFYWSGSNGQFGGAGAPEERITENLQWLDKMKDVRFPSVKDRRRVRVVPDPDHGKWFFLGFLMEETPEQWTVLSNRWRLESVPRREGARIEDIDLLEELKAVRAYGEVRRNPDKNREWPPTELTAFRGTHFPHGGGVYFLLMAYVAHENDRGDDADELLRAGFFTEGHLLKRTFDELAWQQFEAAVLDLSTGAPRAGIAERFRRIEKDFPGGKYEEQARDYADTLKMMATEDAAFRLPDNLDALSPDERARIEIFRLRDCHAVQFCQPGSCWIPSSSFFQNEANAADRLTELGFDAVPQLLEALHDTRLTRSYGFWRDFSPWRYVLQVQDAAIQTLMVISGEQLYESSSTSSYLSNEDEERRATAIAAAKKWWASVQDQDEAAWTRERVRERLTGTLKSNDEHFIRRLAKIDGIKALPEIKAWASRWPKTSYELRVAMGDPDIERELRAKVQPDPATFDLVALGVLKATHKVTKEEYADILYHAGAAMVKVTPQVKVTPHKISSLMQALVDSGESRCVLLAAEALRNGWQTRASWRSIKDPELRMKVASYVLPYTDDETHTGGWRNYCQGKPDIYRVKDDAGISLNYLLGKPLAGFYDESPPERDEAIRRLEAACEEKGITPAFKRPEKPNEDSGEPQSANPPTR